MTHSASRPLFDDECLLWCCPECRASGAVYWAGASGWAVAQQLRRMHREQSPNCYRVFMQLVRPTRWYRDTAELWELLKVKV